jgi:hypothetical protein
MHLNLEINNQAKSPVKKAFFATAWETAFADKTLALPAAKNFKLGPGVAGGNKKTQSHLAEEKCGDGCFVFCGI